LVKIVIVIYKVIKNYLIVAFRNLWKHKGFSVINIAGLALGMTCSLLILLWVQDERGVDAFHQNGKNLYYIYERYHLGGKIETWYWTQGPLAEELKKQIPEIKAGTPFSWPTISTFSVGDKILKQDGFSAGNDFFPMFSYPLLEGRAADALNTPNSISISRKMAADFFGSPADAIGKTVRYENKKDFTVKAVFEDQPSRVSTPFNYIISWSAYLEDNSWAKDYGSVDPRTVIQLRAGSDPKLVENKIKYILDKFNTELGKDNRIELGLQKFDQYYLHSEFKNGYPAGGRIVYVQLFSLVAIFILLIACINFMNLTTARSVKRAREIAVRKVMGALRSLLIPQFIGEAVLMAIIAMTAALILASLALPAFNQLTGKQVHIPFAQFSFWISILGLCFLTGIFSGSYPAFFLSAFNPIQVLKGTLKSGTGAVWFRKGLVVFQFVLSIILIISTILISRQIRYVQTADIGYNRENLLYIPIEGNLTNKLDVFNTEANKLPGVKNVSELTEAPTEMNNGTLSVGWSGKDPLETVRFIQDEIGPDFMRTMNLKLAAGKEFPSDGTFDSVGCIVNETAVKLMGYKDPVGKPVFRGKYRCQIVGVVKDFHFRSLHDPIQPLILGMGNSGKNNRYSAILIRTGAGKTKTALEGLKKLCNELNPAFPFSYKFSDEEYAKLYKSDEVIGNLSVIFAILAIFISCLGLLGLSIFTASQRVKEIGVRKVLGASMASLFTLLSGEFMLLVGLAFAIAAPLGWWAMDNWLNNFAYRTPMPWWIFGIAGLLAMFIALATVCVQALKSANANPVNSLRSE
jgi:putative ABC transport system permease protein